MPAEGRVMDEARKNAFRRILYAAMLDLRAHVPVSPYTRVAWLRPWQWPAAVRRLQTTQLVADWLHNLAAYAASDFRGFDERWFWQEYQSLVTRFPDIEGRLQMYRSCFEWDGPSRDGPPDRLWGTPAAGSAEPPPPNR